MRKADEREQQILMQLRAINIDPTTEEQSFARHFKAKHEPDHVKMHHEKLLREIAEQEALLKEKEDQFREEAYEEIRLSEEKQALVDARNQQLRTILASMQELEAEVDDLDADFDTQLNALLKPDL